MSRCCKGVLICAAIGASVMLVACEKKMDSYKVVEVEQTPVAKKKKPDSPKKFAVKSVTSSDAQSSSAVAVSDNGSSIAVALPVNDIQTQTSSPNALVSDEVVLKPFDRIEIDPALPPLPSPPLPLNVVPSKTQIEEIPLDQAVSQVKAGFVGMKKSVQPGKFLDEKTFRSTANLLGNYADKLETECLDLPKVERIEMLDSIQEAIADLEEATNLKGGQNPGNVQNRIDRAENALRRVENIARLYKQQNK